MRNRTERHRSRFIALGLIILFTIGLPLAGCSSGQGSAPATEPKIEATPETPGTGPEAPPGCEAEKASEPQEDSSDEEQHIPGVTAVDIRLNLEKRCNMRFKEPGELDELMCESGKAVDPDTGVTLLCDIYETPALRIRWVEFMVDGSVVAGTLKPILFEALAKAYLGYCATVPYDGAEQEKARAWVEANVGKANKAGKVLTTTIGPVKFELYGTPWMRVLELKLAEAE